MKKLLAAVLALMMCLACAFAEETAVQTPFEEYAQKFAELTEETWEADVIELIQMLSPEEGVTVSVDIKGMEEGYYILSPRVDPEAYPDVEILSEAASVTLTDITADDEPDTGSSDEQEEIDDEDYMDEEFENEELDDEELGDEELDGEDF